MSKYEQLTTLYTGLLQSLDLKVDEQGLISLQPVGAVNKDGTPLLYPAIVEGKRWVMPTKKILQSAPWDDHIAFHPFSENILNSFSPSLNQLKTVINYKLNTIIGAVFLGLIEFAADKERHGKVGAKASKYLTLIPHELKPLSAERAEDIIKRSDVDNNARKFINVFLKARGALVDGRRYLRGAMVNFPIRDDLTAEEPKVFGVTLSKKEHAAFLAIFDYMLPGADDLDTYSAGSDSHTAPAFEALLAAYAKVAEQLNSIVQTHRKVLPTYDSLMVDLTWLESLTDIERIAVAVPPLPGNVGNPPRESDRATLDKTEKDKPSSRTAPKRAAGLFDDKVTPSAPTDRVPVIPKERTIDAEESVTARQVRQHHELSFAERMAAQKAGGPRAVSQGSRFDSTLGNRASYANTREEPLPAWAENPTATRTVAGEDPNKPSFDTLGRRRSVDDRGGTRLSLSERLERQGMSDGGGSRFGGSSGGSRFGGGRGRVL